MASSGQAVTWAQLEEASNRGAHVFRSLGLGLRDGVAMAANSIDSGTASARLTELVSVSNSG